MATPRELGSLGDAAGSTAPTTNVSIDVGTLFVNGTNNRVGINTTNPSATLEIVGTANISSSFIAGGNVTTTAVELIVGTGQNEEKRVRLQNANTNAYFYVSGTTVGLYSATSTANRWVTDASGNFTATGNITAFSDIKLKTNIHPITNASLTVDKLQGVYYDRKSDNTRRIGFIAQEVQDVLPEVVLADKDGTLSIDYGNVVALLTEAIKELKAKVEALESKVK